MIPSLARAALGALTATLLASTPVAQCPFTSLSMQSYGQSCTPVFFGNPPTLAGSLDVNQCTLDLTVDAFPGCCNTYLTARLLVLGFQQRAIPVPQIGPGCTLLVQPIGTFFLLPAGGDTFTLDLPLVPPPFTFQAQAAAFYFTTIGLTVDAQLTSGQTVTLS